MDRHQLIRATLQRLWAIVRRRPRTAILAFAVFVVIFVPMVPFTPECGPYISDMKPVYGPMTDDYRYSVKSHFRAYGVYYWNIGGEIYLRPLQYLFDSDDNIHNAGFKAAWALASKLYVGSYVGTRMNRRIYTAPPHIEALRDPATGKFETDSCKFMYTVVTGKPEPAEAE